MMNTYDFKLILGNVSGLTDDQSDALFQAGCDDGTLVTRDGIALIRFSRESSSLEEAIHSAAMDVRGAGFQVAHVEVPSPV